MKSDDLAVPCTNCHSSVSSIREALEQLVIASEYERATREAHFVKSNPKAWKESRELHRQSIEKAKRALEATAL